MGQQGRLGRTVQTFSDSFWHFTHYIGGTLKYTEAGADGLHKPRFCHALH